MNKERLERLSYFDDMSSQEVDIIASTMREDAWWDGAVIVQQGDQGGCVYFVLEGQVQVKRQLEEGEIVGVGTLGPGAAFGLLGVMAGTQRAASCVAKGQVRCAVMERGDFLDLIQGNTTLSLRFQLAILRCLARDIRSTNTKLAELVAYPACDLSAEDLVEVFGEQDAD